MKEIQLSKLEIVRAYGFIQMHPNEDLFSIKTDKSSGIGQGVDISVVGKSDTREDITDYNLW